MALYPALFARVASLQAKNLIAGNLLSGRSIDRNRSGQHLPADRPFRFPIGRKKRPTRRFPYRERTRFKERENTGYTYRGSGVGVFSPLTAWYAQGESNPCLRRERASS